jgi:hypothetical protein
MLDNMYIDVYIEQFGILPYWYQRQLIKPTDASDNDLNKVSSYRLVDYIDPVSNEPASYATQFGTYIYANLSTGTIFYIEIFRNPSLEELKICGEGARGFIDIDGNLILSTSANHVVHEDIHNILLDSDHFVQQQTNFPIDIQRYEKSNKICLGESYCSMDTEELEKIKSIAIPLFKKAKEIHGRVLESIKSYANVYKGRP